MHDVREVRTAGILFCSGSEPWSRAIRAATHSKWSHVGLLVDVEGQTLVLESREPVGVRLEPLSTYRATYAGEVWVATVDLDLEAAVAWGVTQLGDPYDWAEIAEITGRLVLGLGKRTSSRGWICSEYVAAMMTRGGVTVRAQRGGFVTPGDVAACPAVRMGARLR